MTIRKAKLLVFRRDDGRCFYCGTPLTPKSSTLDHIFPKSLGGHGFKSNLVLACVRCNHAKGSLTVEEFLATEYGRKASWYKNITMV